jgi:ferredoxin-NADP reductase
MLPYVLIGGLLIVRKTLRSDLVYSFVIVALFTIIAPKFVFDAGILSSILKIFTNTPLVFFACIMLTEPFTTPPTARLQMVYGVIVGFLFAPAMHIGSFYTTPELALLVGNVFSYIVSPKRRLALTLVEKNQLSPDIYDFVFKSDTSLAFRPGQYLEWTLGHEAPDARGNRRYFTIASAPTESMIRVGAKFYDNSSTFKKNLRDLNTGDVIFASQLAGDFTLPREKNRKLVFIAGGIGVTPFRSMVQYMIDMKEQRQVVMLYAGKTPQDLVYSDIFTKARLAFGMKTVYVVNKNEPYLPGITEGVITTDLIIKEIPDYKERDFYISGPHGMVMAFTDTLQTIGIPKRRIHSDFFPGLV